MSFDFKVQLETGDIDGHQFKYNPTSGQLWKLSKLHSIGWYECPLTPSSEGYPRVKINNKSINQHRVIFFIMKGYWPVMVDHINGDKLDNRWNNLREVTNRENQGNTQYHRDGNLPGVSLQKSGRWKAQAVVNGKKTHLGIFNSPEEAHEKYTLAIQPEPTKVIHTFKGQLEVGNRGEALFMENYPAERGKIEIYAGREYDFTRSDGKKIELKTDTYNIHKTDNFFFERYSDINYKDKPGGPWRSYKDNVDIFYYMFVRHNIWFEFPVTLELIDRLDKFVEKKGMVYVKNKGWITGGYKVPRKIVEEFYMIGSFNTETLRGTDELIKLLGGKDGIK